MITTVLVRERTSMHDEKETSVRSSSKPRKLSPAQKTKQRPNQLRQLHLPTPTSHSPHSTPSTHSHSPHCYYHHHYYSRPTPTWHYHAPHIYNSNNRSSRPARAAATGDPARNARRGYVPAVRTRSCSPRGRARTSPSGSRNRPCWWKLRGGVGFVRCRLAAGWGAGRC